jgi:ATP-dependent Clp protease ATP-binding subunit ClpA
MNGYNFTERVRKVLALAREEASFLHHEYVGTEHILLGLVREGEGVAATVLQNLSVDLDRVRDRIEEIVRRGKAANATGPDLPYTSRAKKVLEFSMSEARDLHHSYVGTEHVLLGLLREEKGIAAQVLVEAGCSLETAREETLRILGTEVQTSGPRAPIAERISLASASGTVNHLIARRIHVSADDRRVSARIASVAARAHLAASEMLHREILPEHYLLALLDENEGSAIALLDRLGADRAKLREALTASLDAISRDAQPETEVSTQQVDLLFLGAERERKQADTPLLSTHHLLIAMATRETGVGVILREAGLTAEQLREEARRISG